MREKSNKGYKTCKDVYKDSSSNGVYDLLELGHHYCIVTSLPNCGGGGWTLAMKINGSEATFNESSAYWTNSATFNVENGLASFDSNEAKFLAFSQLSFEEICVGMKFNGTLNWLNIPLKRPSLLSVFLPGIYIPTQLGRNTWKSLITQPSLQLNCNLEGFNVMNSYGWMVARIGIVANGEYECDSPDSYIGLGTNRKMWFCGKRLNMISCGNYASCGPENLEKDSAAFGYILVK